MLGQHEVIHILCLILLLWLQNWTSIPDLQTSTLTRVLTLNVMCHPITDLNTFGIINVLATIMMITRKIAVNGVRFKGMKLT